MSWKDWNRLCQSNIHWNCFWGIIRGAYEMVRSVYIWASQELWYHLFLNWWDLLFLYESVKLKRSVILMGKIEAIRYTNGGKLKLDKPWRWKLGRKIMPGGHFKHTRLYTAPDLWRSVVTMIALGIHSDWWANFRGSQCVHRFLLCKTTFFF